ncbi:MAG: hypothetical protein JO151_20335 [Verrucomicrobia bacterium]|nr:hypothetical protein [Verrucomicrobiota bacterium]
MVDTWVIRALSALLAVALMGAYLPAKESKIRRSAIYFQTHLQTGATDFYLPPRSPGGTIRPVAKGYQRNSF